MSSKNTAKQRLINEALNQQKDDESKSSKLPTQLNTAKKRVLENNKTSSSSSASRKKAKMPDKKNDASDDSDNDVDFRRNVTDLYLRNNLSAKQTAGLVRSAHKSGVEGVDDMKKIGKRCPRNAQRDIMRKIKKDITWPEPYMAQIPVKDRKNGKRSLAWFPFILVSQVLCHIMLAMGGGFKDILDFPVGSGLANRKAKWEREQRVPDNVPLAPIGIHGDGVPIQQRSSIYMSYRGIFAVVVVQKGIDLPAYPKKTSAIAVVEGGAPLTPCWRYSTGTLCVYILL